MVKGKFQLQLTLLLVNLFQAKKKTYIIIFYVR